MSITIEGRSLKSGIISYYAGPVSLCEANRADWHSSTPDEEKATQFPSVEEALAVREQIGDGQYDTPAEVIAACSSTDREQWLLDVHVKGWGTIVAVGEPPRRRKKLTQKEIDVLGLRRRGFGVEQIAVKLKIKVETVERRLQQALLKVEPECAVIANSVERLDEILTPRELEIIELRARGLQNNEIAARLNIEKINSKSGTSETVKGHIKNAASKGIKLPRVKRYF